MLPVKNLTHSFSPSPEENTSYSAHSFLLLFSLIYTTHSSHHHRYRKTQSMRTMKSDTAILRHAQFWDRQKKGYITPIDAVTGKSNNKVYPTSPSFCVCMYIFDYLSSLLVVSFYLPGMMRLGYSTLSSIFFGSFLGVIIAYAMQDAWLMFDPRCRIYIERLIHIKRRRGDSMYDIDGRLNVQVFEGLYDKYARHDMSGCSMTLSEAMHMASEHGSFGLSPSEWYFKANRNPASSTV
ncbi:hypothetical protein BX666DRAFT_170140 [Dichotomocladium elegans]|nr:hypothetical protein BX666DRAFT_170140 [Dichotomocladium elegans]